jgi:hypothetical protein
VSFFSTGELLPPQPDDVRRPARSPSPCQLRPHPAPQGLSSMFKRLRRAPPPSRSLMSTDHATCGNTWLLSVAASATTLARPQQIVRCPRSSLPSLLLLERIQTSRSFTLGPGFTCKECKRTTGHCIHNPIICIQLHILRDQRQILQSVAE